MTAMGHIYLYYGTGGGKTTAALGIALRSVAHGHHVTVIQFLKHWKETGEYKAAKTLGPLYDIRQFGRQGWIKAAKAKDEVSVGGFKATLRRPSEEDKLAAAEALRYAERVIKGDHPPELLILDEVCLAAHMGIIDDRRRPRLTRQAAKGDGRDTDRAIHAPETHRQSRLRKRDQGGQGPEDLRLTRGYTVLGYAALSYPANNVLYLLQLLSDEPALRR